MGFHDPDRQSPKHDQIQMWAYAHFDKLIRICYPHFPPEYPDPTVQLEYPIHEKREWGEPRIVGFMDLYSLQFGLAVEVKSVIRSMGDLLRQIQFYRSYSNANSWIVVSPDARLEGILKAHGIYFLKYQAEGELF